MTLPNDLLQDLHDQLGTTGDALAVAVVSTIGVYVAVIALTRLAGVRSLATMSSFDFAATVAVGSTVSSAATGSVPVSLAATALLGLYLLQYVVALLRRRGALHGLVDNTPLLLVREGVVCEANLRRGRVSESELWAQVRLHGALSVDQVRLAVLETTGAVSVVTGDGPVDPRLLDGVRTGR